MSFYSKGFNEGYQKGLKAGIDLVLKRYASGIEFAGAIRKKQNIMLVDDIKVQHANHAIPKATCGYARAWSSQCDCTELLDNGQCKNHQGLCSCGELATQECAHAGQFVCGRPLCDKCKCNH